MSTILTGSLRSTIADAFVFRATVLEDKEKEARAFVQKAEKENTHLANFEKAIICAWTDGILYGNWPWVISAEHLRNLQGHLDD